MSANYTKIVIIGGGFGGLFTALDLAGAGEITLINDEDHFLVQADALRVPERRSRSLAHRARLQRTARRKGAVHPGRCYEVDLDARTVTVAGRAEPISYDVLVVAPGAVTNYAGVAGRRTVCPAIPRLERRQSFATTHD